MIDCSMTYCKAFEISPTHFGSTFLAMTWSIIFLITCVQVKDKELTNTLHPKLDVFMSSG